MQCEDILKRFERLLAENVSVYVAASVPTLATNSTDLEFLEEKGNYLTSVMHSKLQYCKKASERNWSPRPILAWWHGFTGQALRVH